MESLIESRARLVTYVLDDPLTLPRGILDDILSRVKLAMPYEICGYFAGVGRSIYRAFPIPNVAANPGDSFCMEPMAQLNALITVDKYDWHMIAVYHSHPPGKRCYPSLRDIEGQPDPSCMHVIFAPTANGKIINLGAFAVRKNNQIAIPINVVESPVY